MKKSINKKAFALFMSMVMLTSVVTLITPMSVGALKNTGDANLNSISYDFENNTVGTKPTSSNPSNAKLNDTSATPIYTGAVTTYPGRLATYNYIDSETVNGQTNKFFHYYGVQNPANGVGIYEGAVAFGETSQVSASTPIILETKIKYGTGLPEIGIANLNSNLTSTSSTSGTRNGSFIATLRFQKDNTLQYYYSGGVATAFPNLTLTPGTWYKYYIYYYVSNALYFQVNSIDSTGTETMIASSPIITTGVPTKAATTMAIATLQKTEPDELSLDDVKLYKIGADNAIRMNINGENTINKFIYETKTSNLSVNAIHNETDNIALTNYVPTGLTWSVLNSPQGVSISSTGVLTVDTTAQSGKVTVQLSGANYTTSTKDITINIDPSPSVDLEIAYEKSVLDIKGIASDNSQIALETKTDAGVNYYLVNSNIYLPVTGAIGSTITWAVDVGNESIVEVGANLGKVNALDNSKRVKLTATLSKAGGTDVTKDFWLEVVGLKEKKLYADYNALAFSNTSTLFVVNDTNYVTGNVALPSMGTNGSAITWQSSDNSIISSTGVVNKQVYNAYAKLTATLTYLDVTINKDLNFVVLGNGYMSEIETARIVYNQDFSYSTMTPPPTDGNIFPITGNTESWAYDGTNTNRKANIRTANGIPNSSGNLNYVEVTTGTVNNASSYVGKTLAASYSERLFVGFDVNYANTGSMSIHLTSGAMTGAKFTGVDFVDGNLSIAGQSLCPLVNNKWYRVEMLVDIASKLVDISVYDNQTLLKSLTKVPITTTLTTVDRFVINPQNVNNNIVRLDNLNIFSPIASTMDIIGTDTIEVPKTGNSTYNYQTKLTTLQGWDLAPRAVNWTVTGTATGLTMGSNNVLSISDDATSGSAVLTATLVSGTSTLTATKTINVAIPTIPEQEIVDRAGEKLFLKDAKNNVVTLTGEQTLIFANLNLEQSIMSCGRSILITWTADTGTENCVNISGSTAIVTLPSVDTNATLVASYNYNGITGSKTFKFLVPQVVPDNIATKVDLEEIAIKGYIFNNTEYVSSDLDLYTLGQNGSSIAWTSTKPEIISITGDVNRPKYNTKVTLTATVQKVSSIVTKDYPVVVIGTGDIDLKITNSIITQLDCEYSDLDEQPKDGDVFPISTNTDGWFLAGSGSQKAYFRTALGVPNSSNKLNYIEYNIPAKVGNTVSLNKSFGSSRTDRIVFGTDVNFAPASSGDVIKMTFNSGGKSVIDGDTPTRAFVSIYYKGGEIHVSSIKDIEGKASSPLVCSGLSDGKWYHIKADIDIANKLVDVYVYENDVEKGSLLNQSIITTAINIDKFGFLPDNNAGNTVRFDNFEVSIPSISDLEIDGTDTLTIPKDADITSTYTVYPKDLNGKRYYPRPVNWTIEGNPAGVTMDSNGVLHVTNKALEGSITLKAVQTTSTDIVASKTINLVAPNATPEEFVNRLNQELKITDTQNNVIELLPTGLTRNVNDMLLPSKFVAYGKEIDIAWLSDNQSIVTIDGETGYVTIPASDTSVTLTASYLSVSSDFKFVVPNTLVVPDVQAVRYDKKALAINSQLINSFGSVQSDISLPISGAFGSKIWWVSDNTVMSNTGMITRPSADTPFKMIATLTKGTETLSYEFPAFAPGVSQSSTSSTSSYTSSGGGGGGGSGSIIPNVIPNVIPTQFEFEDISGDDIAWAKDSITSLFALGVVNGKTDKTFEPKDNVTRAEFIKMLIKAFKLEDSSATADFTDVQVGDWSYISIATAKKLGIVNGYPDNSFGVSNQITRQEMSVMVFRAAKAAGIDFGNVEPTEIFTDKDEVALYAIDAVEALQGVGIINGIGEGKFGPDYNANRAQAAKIIYLIITKYKLNV